MNKKDKTIEYLFNVIDKTRDLVNLMTVPENNKIEFNEKCDELELYVKKMNKELFP